MHVVTGASSGIGRGIVIALGERFVPVLAVARRADVAEAVAVEAGPSVTAVSADVATETGITAIVEAVGGRPVGSLVHCAASVIPLEPWTDVDPEDLLTHLRVHVAAPIALTRALLDRGPVERMAIIDSFSATTPRNGWAAYAIVKAAAQMSARNAAAELPDTHVVRIFPGAVETPLLDSVLGSDDSIPAVGFYRALAEGGKVSDPIEVGRQITSILLDATAGELSERQVWHVGHSA